MIRSTKLSIFDRYTQNPARFSSTNSSSRRIFIYASSRLLSLRLLLESATKRMITRIVCSELLAYPWKGSQGNGAVFPLIPRFFEPRRRAEWLQRDDGLLVPVYGPVECRPVAFSWWTLPISDGLVSGSESIVSLSAFLFCVPPKACDFCLCRMPFDVRGDGSSCARLEIAC